MGLYWGAVLGGCIGGLYWGAVLWGCIGGLYWGAVLGGCIGGLYWGAVLGGCIGGLYWGAVLGGCIGGLYWGVVLKTSNFQNLYDSLNVEVENYVKSCLAKFSDSEDMFDKTVFLKKLSQLWSNHCKQTVSNLCKYTQV